MGIGSALFDGIMAAGSFGQSIWRDLWSMKRDDDRQAFLAFREDTAVQRRVRDLKAAGLSPTLAAGSAANSGVVSTTPPQGGAFVDALNAAASVQAIRNARQENANMRKSAEVMDSQKALNFSNSLKAASEARFTDALAGKVDYEKTLLSENAKKVIQEIENLKEQKNQIIANIGHTNKETEKLTVEIKEKMQELNDYLETGLQPNQTGPWSWFIRDTRKRLNNLNQPEKKKKIVYGKGHHEKIIYE